MTAQPSAVPDDFHRELAIGLFNETWRLIEKAERSADDEVAMLLSAMASRWHWGQVGGASETATGDWLISHVACLMAMGDLALRFARASLTLAESEGWDGWRLASAHEGMARACAVSGDPEGRARHLAAAGGALEREPSPEDREAISEQLSTVPGTAT
ncbi:MAG: hypothetical protein M0T80_01810 [Actinomycetota bacterium]|nr:hypothetical protein [Actinomycetota bacterium]